jgi:hypothetical protein
MTQWTSSELARIGDAEELQIAFQRRDGTLASPRTIWVVRHGDDLYVRSVNGRDAAWFRGTEVRHTGHVQSGGVDRDVDFADADPSLDDELDAAYRSKYRRYAASIVNSIVSPQAKSATIRLVPRQAGSASWSQSGHFA